MQYIITFLAVFFVDIFYIFYLKAIENNHALKASLWAVVVFFIGSVAIIEYTQNTLMLIPACLGAFCGTYVGIRFKRR
jgi:hypothetical protein